MALEINAAAALFCNNLPVPNAANVKGGRASTGRTDTDSLFRHLPGAIQHKNRQPTIRRDRLGKVLPIPKDPRVHKSYLLWGLMYVTLPGCLGNVSGMHLNHVSAWIANNTAAGGHLCSFKALSQTPHVCRIMAFGALF